MREIFAVQFEDGKKVRKWIQLEDRECVFCGKQFTPLRQDSQYCSRKCSLKSENKRHAERYREKSREYYADHKKEISKKRKQRYFANPDHWRAKSREWAKSFREHKKETNIKYKDRIRHDGKREKLIKENGLICSECGKTGNRFQIITHHATFNSKDHAVQVLLCRACHARLHKLNIG